MAKEAEFPEKEEVMDTVFKDVHPSASLSAVMEAPADAPVPKLPCIVRAVSEVTSENALVARALAPPKLFVMDGRRKASEDTPTPSDAHPTRCAETE
jgi:hypothetical protein